MKTLLTLVLAVGLTSAVTADEVQLKNGGKLQGIAREEADRIVVDTGAGTLTLKADEVDAVIPGKTDLQEYQERVAALECAPDAAAIFETALWAQERRLKACVPKLLYWTLALEPDHEQARELLGYVRFEGRWLTTVEREALLKVQDQCDPYAQKAAKKEVRRSRNQPEISPGYTYLGFPPSVPRTGSRNQGYGGYVVPGIATPVRGMYITP